MSKSWVTVRNRNIYHGFIGPLRGVMPIPAKAMRSVAHNTRSVLAVQANEAEPLGMFPQRSAVRSICQSSGKALRLGIHTYKFA